MIGECKYGDGGRTVLPAAKKKRRLFPFVTSFGAGVGCLAVGQFGLYFVRIFPVATRLVLPSSAPALTST